MTPFEWKNMTIGKSYDEDKAFGFQCWDYGALLWGNIGRYGHAGVPYNYPYLSTANTGYAYGIWLARTENAGSEFDLIYNRYRTSHHTPKNNYQLFFKRLVLTLSSSLF